MIVEVNNQKKSNNLQNINVVNRDFISEGTGIFDNAADFVMIFNILHHEKPFEILHEAFRILKPGSRAGIIHWNYDQNTPRGPSMDIRPTPEDIKKWVLEAGFKLNTSLIVDLPPYHYGLLAYKP